MRDGGKLERAGITTVDPYDQVDLRIYSPTVASWTKIQKGMAGTRVSMLLRWSQVPEARQWEECHRREDRSLVAWAEEEILESLHESITWRAAPSLRLVSSSVGKTLMKV